MFETSKRVPKTEKRCFVFKEKHICINLIIWSQAVGENFSAVGMCLVPSTTLSS